MTDDEIIALAKEKFEAAREREQDTRLEGLDDLKFARLGEQWPETIKRQRELEFRPCLTINKLPTFIRQVVNDVRQNKPGIVVHPADDNADVETADVYNGLIRNIQAASDADVATDTAAESAVSNGFGYFRINITAEGDELAFERIGNPFSVYGDPYSTAADSSDWDCAFVVTMLSKDKFEKQYNNAEAVDWEADGYTGLPSPWMDDDQVMVAEYWHREEVDETVVTLSDGREVPADYIETNMLDLLMAGINPTAERTVKAHKVTQYILSGAKVLETVEWPGKFIPIVPVYGDEINVEGKRVFRSLINSAKDAQRMHNYWRTMATELIALAPKAPFIGRKGAFDSDPRWNSANTASHAFLEYDGPDAPQRQPFAGVPAGALQEALNAADDMKAIIGIYDASLGARSNETSGRAIMARQREGDVSTFHFIDNLSRAIRHAGRILLDLIPKVYSKERVIRILGEDMKPKTVRVAPGAPQGAQMPPQQGMQPQPGEQPQMGAQGDPVDRIYDLTAGKYDLIVKSGPSFTSQREEARQELIEIIRSVPESAQVLGPMYLRQSDWPGAEAAADKIEQGAQQQGTDPAAAAQAQADAMKTQVDAMKAENDRLKADNDTIKANAAHISALADMLRAQGEVAFAGQAATNPYGGVAHQAP
jgi:hypothetical protein